MGYLCWKTLHHLVAAMLLLAAISASSSYCYATTFESRKLRLGSQTLIVEIADTDKRRAKGLMYRTELSKGRGMLFIFPTKKKLSFWTKNTFVPLTIGYFDEHKSLLETQDMSPVKSVMDTKVSTYRSRKPAKYALEVNRGWFRAHKIKVGDKFKFIKNSNSK